MGFSVVTLKSFKEKLEGSQELRKMLLHSIFQVRVAAGNKAEEQRWLRWTTGTRKGLKSQERHHVSENHIQNGETGCRRARVVTEQVQRKL